MMSMNVWKFHMQSFQNNCKYMYVLSPTCQALTLNFSCGVKQYPTWILSTIVRVLSSENNTLPIVFWKLKNAPLYVRSSGKVVVLLNWIIESSYKGKGSQNYDCINLFRKLNFFFFNSFSADWFSSSYGYFIKGQIPLVHLFVFTQTLELFWHQYFILQCKQMHIPPLIRIT